MKKTILLFAAMLIAMAATVSLAAEMPEKITVPTQDLQGYTAPALKSTVRPATVVINRREVTGYVTLELLVNEKGKVDEAKVLYRTSRFAVRNAVAAASRWTFTPAMLNGKPVKAYVAYNVPFGRQLDVFQESSYASTMVDDDNTMVLKH